METELAVLIQAQPAGGVRVWVPALRPLEMTALTREQALAGVRCVIAEQRPEAELVLIEVPGTDRNSWLESADIFADDPTWEEYNAEVLAARRRDDPHLYDDDE